MRYLCCAMCFTVHIIFIHFDKHSSDLGLDTCLAPKGLTDRLVARGRKRLCTTGLYFRQLFSALDNEYGELLLHCEVRLLSKVKALPRFLSLVTSNLEFLAEIIKLLTERECLNNY